MVINGHMLGKRIKQQQQQLNNTNKERGLAAYFAY